MTKQAKRYRRFATVLILAALYSMDRFTVREVLRSLRMVWVGLTSRQGTVDRLTYFRRLRCCQRCPVYYSPLRTCGSPLASITNVGCWCLMERKATLAQAKCWIDENEFEDYLEYGWNHNLK